MKEIVSVGTGENEYVINGVRYIVSSRFIPENFHKIENTITDKLKNFIGGDFADLITDEENAKIDAEYVMTAGKEE